MSQKLKGNIAVMVISFLAEMFMFAGGVYYHTVITESHLYIATLIVIPFFVSTFRVLYLTRPVARA